MVSKIKVHMGLHKTATTTFQVACLQQYQKLKEHNICYSKEGNAEGNHSCLFRPDDIKFEKIKEIIEGSKEEHILFSAESICRLSLREFSELRSLFLSYTNDIEFFAAIRCPYSYAESHYQEVYKQGIAFSKLSASYNKLKHDKEIFEHNPDIKVLIFEDLITHPKGVSYALAEKMQLPLSVFEETKNMRENVGSSQECVNILEKLGGNLYAAPLIKKEFKKFTKGEKVRFKANEVKIIRIACEELRLFYNQQFHTKYQKKDFQTYNQKSIWGRGAINDLDKVLKNLKGSHYLPIVLYAVKVESRKYKGKQRDRLINLVEKHIKMFL